MIKYIILFIVLFILVLILLYFNGYLPIFIKIKDYDDIEIELPTHIHKNDSIYDKNTINILIRTSKRYNCFKRCMESIKRQNYDNYRVIVSVDNDETLEYVKECDIVDDILVFEQNSTRDFRWNLYFNHLMDICNDGWIIFLDDDNMLSDNNSLVRVIESVDSVDMLYIFKCVRYIEYSKLFIKIPMRNNQKLPTIGDVDTACLVINSKYKNAYKWKSKKAGDYSYMKSVTSENDPLPFIRINKYFITNTGAGLGKQRDI